ncbi:hypothetical protein LCGC14_2985610 [marine sediment metagenome]|uniref:Uncharacterized protein n=1 Tax=marine sediment metagenome TaxID=412755 RepID=A0A0F8X594_9ZZZZ
MPLRKIVLILKLKLKAKAGEIINMGKEEAKGIISDILAEVWGDIACHKLPEGVSSEDFVKNGLQDVYANYFCKDRVLSIDNPKVKLEVA